MKLVYPLLSTETNQFNRISLSVRKMREWNDDILLFHYECKMAARGKVIPQGIGAKRHWTLGHDMMWWYLMKLSRWPKPCYLSLLPGKAAPSCLPVRGIPLTLKANYQKNRTKREKSNTEENYDLLDPELFVSSFCLDCSSFLYFFLQRTSVFRIL
jgi:hypothetical protein